MSESQLYRKPPGDLQLEKCALSCLMQAPDATIAAALELLTPADFQNEGHGLIFATVTKRIGEGLPVDPVSLTSHFIDKGILQAVGGPGEISEVYTASPNPAHIRHYASEVALFSCRRQIIAAGSELISLAFDGSPDCEWKEGVGAVMAPTMQRLDLLLSQSKGAEIRELKQVAQKYMDFYGSQGPEGIDPAVPTGSFGLDSLLCGGVRREYIIIGAKQGHGKTLLAMQLAGTLAAKGRPGLVVGYEMQDMEVLMRDIARESNVPLNQVMGREPFENPGTNREVTRKLSQMMTEWDVGYIDNPRITLESVFALAKARKREGRLDWLVVDYLQLIPRRRLAKERSDELLMEFSKQLNIIRKELGCTVIAPVQLNDDGMIRDGRSILDAPQVFLRIEMDESESKDETVVADTGKIRVLKNRFGATNRVCHVLRQGEFQRFVDSDPPAPKKDETIRVNRRSPSR